MVLRLLTGLSWKALALVAGFCALQALEWVLSPKSGVIGGDAADLALGFLSRLTVFLITGATMLVAAIVVLNAFGRAGRENFGVAIIAVVASAGAAALVRYAVGAVPEGEGARYMLLIFTSWLGSSAVLVAGYMYYLRAQVAQEESLAAELRRGALETQQLATRLRLLQAQVEPHFLFNTLSNVRRLSQNDAPAGRAMLAQLTRYLRAALPRMREHEVERDPERDDARLQVLGTQPFVREVADLHHEAEAERDEDVALAEAGEDIHGRGRVMTAATPRGAFASR